MMVFGNEFNDMPTENVSVQPNINLSIIPNVTFQLGMDRPGPITLNIPYTVLEILVGVVAIVGNAMVIFVFHRDRRLRRRTNYYIVSLALADLLVGLLGIPFAILASIGLPTNLYTCLFTVSLLVVLCTISIFCLVAVSVDRYWAILYPLAYSKNVSTKTAIVIISFCWFLGTMVGFLPLFGWHRAKAEEQACFFVKIMDYNYLVFLYVATIITPAILLFAFYAHIYTVIIKQVRQTVTFTCGDKSFKSDSSLCKTKTNGGGMLRVLGAARKREVKATQNLSTIVLFFMLCWLPLYTINCIQAFCPTCSIEDEIVFAAIILSHLNSAVNPLLYAYNLKDFRAALKTLMYRMICKEVQEQNINYRFSIASQHRIQALIEKQTSMRQRIYVDSPVWRREQQQIKRNQRIHSDTTNCGSKNIRTKQIWNIAEVSSICDSSSKNIFPEEYNHNFQLVDKRLYSNNADKCEYSFNYDHLDKDGSCTNSNHSQDTFSRTPVLRKTKHTEPKLTFSISLDNLPSIPFDSKCDLQQISLLVNVKLESRPLKSIQTPILSAERQTSLPCRFKTFSLQNIGTDLNTSQIIENHPSCKLLIKPNEQRLNVRELFRFKTCDENSNKISKTSQLKRTKSDSDCLYDKLSLTVDEMKL